MIDACYNLIIVTVYFLILVVKTSLTQVKTYFLAFTGLVAVGLVGRWVVVVVVAARVGDPQRRPR